jgi:plastocyanin
MQVARRDQCVAAAAAWRGVRIPAVLVAIPLALGGVGTAAAATHTILIEAMAFVPAMVKVEQGDRIVWINKDPFPHTVTATDESFDSGAIAESQSWSFLTSGKTQVDYVCTLHPTMKGTLEVR